MNIDWQLVVYEPLINRKEFLTIQSLPVQIRETPKPAETEVVDRALQLIERCFNIARRQREKTDKAFGMAACNGGDGIVGSAGDFDRVAVLEAIGARSGNCQHMNINAKFIHVL